VDDLISLALLVEKARRTSPGSVPPLRDVIASSEAGNVQDLWTAVGQSASSPLLAAVFRTTGADKQVPVPDNVLDSPWPERIGEALNLMSPMEVPYAFFGDFHQMCLARPLEAAFFHFGTLESQRRRQALAAADHSTPARPAKPPRAPARACAPQGRPGDLTPRATCHQASHAGIRLLANRRGRHYHRGNWGNTRHRTKEHLMAKRLKVGIIGTGMIAVAGHIPAWQNLKEEVEIVAGADILPDRAKLVAKTYGIPHAYGDWKKMLRELKLDIVSVCTPNSYHKEHTIAALKAGAHVLCEKPVATSRADAAEMYAAADKAGRLLMVGQTARFSPKSRAAKEIADSGKLGEMYYAETYYLRRRGIPKWGQFHMKVHSGGGPIYDLGVHAIDLLFWIMGNPKPVAVSGATYTKIGNRDEQLATSLADSGAPMGVLTPRPYNWRDFDVEDMAAGFIRLAGGGAVAFKTSWAANIPEGTGYTMILGSEGGLILDPLTLSTNQGSYQVNVVPQVPGGFKVDFSGHWEEVIHFVNVIRGKEELIVKREEVLNVIGVLDALYKSAAEGREVKVART
jgi:predicted dehydrogenase